MKYFSPNRYLRLYILPAIFTIISLVSHAQVVTQDSLALINLFSATNGNNWANRTNWLNGNVGSWFGIQVVNHHVSRINLSNNNLTGDIPASLANLSSLVYLNLSNNNITSLPNLSGITTLDTLLVNGNQLTFKDLLPNTSADSLFVYAPQDSVDAPMDTLLLEQSTLAMQTRVDTQAGVVDQFQWFHNGDSITGANSRAYTLVCFDSAAQGDYTCRIRNTNLPQLTIWKRIIHVSFQRLANAGSNIEICDSSSSLLGNRPLTGTGHWDIINGSGSASILSPDSAVTEVTQLAPGANLFRWTMSNNNLCPSSYSYVIITRDLSPQFTSAGPDINACSPQVFLQADTPFIGIGTWTVVSGTGVVAQPNSATSAVNNLSYGDNILRWQIFNGVCPPSVFDEVKIWRDDSLTAVNAGADQNVCPTNTSLTAATPSHASGFWSVISGTAAFADSTYDSTAVSSLSEGANVLLWTVNNSCHYAISDTVVVTVYNFIHANAGDDTTIYYDPLHPYPLGNGVSVGTGGNGQYGYTWSPATNLNDATIEHPGFLTTDIGDFDFSVTVTDGNTCSATSSVQITVVKENVLAVPSLFTPNGDGVNDVFYIPGIESYPGNELSVYDRNGQLVFRMNDYNNSWDGVSNEGMLYSNTALKTDTYFYVLKLDDSKTQKGYVELKR